MERLCFMISCGFFFMGEKSIYGIYENGVIINFYEFIVFFRFNRISVLKLKIKIILKCKWLFIDFFIYVIINVIMYIFLKYKNICIL